MPVAYFFLNVCMYGQYFRSTTENRCQICSWSSEEEKIAFFLSSFAPKNVVSRNRFGGPIPRKPAHSSHSRLNLVLTCYGILPCELLFFAYSTTVLLVSSCNPLQYLVVCMYLRHPMLHFVLLMAAAAVLVSNCRFCFMWHISSSTNHKAPP